MKQKALRQKDSIVTAGNVLVVVEGYEEIVILDSLLSEADFTVRAARTGADGLRAISAKAPDIVLLDIMLSDMDGLEVCETLQRSSEHCDVPVIILSTLNDTALKAQAFEAGARDFITKPFLAADVLIRVMHQVELVRLRAQLDEAARTYERQHIARELHDSVSQTLFILNATVQAMLADETLAGTKLEKDLRGLSVLSKSALAEMRTLLHELRPSQLVSAPLQKLLHQLVEAFRLRLNADVSLFAMDVSLPTEIKLVFYRIAQEAVTNIAKHARAERVNVRLADQSTYVSLLIEDNGHGFDPESVEHGMGLHTMRERAEKAGLRLRIESAPNAGTQVEAIWDKAVWSVVPGHAQWEGT